MIGQQEIGLTIKNICPGLPEIGKIKIGEKGQMVTSKQGKQFQPPKKLDHIRVTTLERNKDGNFAIDQEIHAKIGEKPTKVAIRLLYDDPEVNFPTRLSCYDGTKLFCSGNNEIAFQGNKKIPCPCKRLDPEYEGRGKCKYNGVLSVILDTHQRVGGVWKFRTTSYNSVINILSSMAMIQRITGGKLSGIPLDLVLLPKTVTTPITGKLQVVYVVGLEYQGSMLDLAKDSADAVVEQIENKERILKIEHRAKQAMLANGSMENESIKDIIEEFYPEEAMASKEIDPVSEVDKAKVAELKAEMKTDHGKGPPGGYGPDEIVPNEFKDPDPLARENWINLKTKGYSTFVHKHLEEIEAILGTPLYTEMLEKWVDFYEMPWPHDPAPIEVAESTPQVEQKQESGSTDDKEALAVAKTAFDAEDEMRKLKAQFNYWKAANPEAVAAAHNSPALSCNAKPREEWGVADYKESVEEIKVQDQAMKDGGF